MINATNNATVGPDHRLISDHFKLLTARKIERQEQRGIRIAEMSLASLL
jgi:hypothetical protein